MRESSGGVPYPVVGEAEQNASLLDSETFPLRCFSVQLLLATPVFAEACGPHPLDCWGG